MEDKDTLSGGDSGFCLVGMTLKSIRRSNGDNSVAPDNVREN